MQMHHVSGHSMFCKASPRLSMRASQQSLGSTSSENATAKKTSPNSSRGAGGGSYRKLSADRPAPIIMPPAEVVAPVSSNNLGKHRALVLDCAYRPINVTSWPRAVMMDWTQKAEVVEYYPPPALAQSGQGLHPLPAVVRVSAYIDLHEVGGDVAPTRRNLMTRDKFCCQYCGCRGKEHELTLDHVQPASKGGKNTWLNLVTACMPCNQRKGDRLLTQLPGWKLRSVPRRPSPWEIGIVVGLGVGDIERPPVEWAPYLEPYRVKMQEIKRRAIEAGLESPTEDDDQGEIGSAAWNLPVSNAKEDPAGAVVVNSIA